MGGGLSDAEVEKMVQEAEEMRESDQRKKDTVQARNDAETLGYQVEKQLADLKDKMSTAEADELKSKLEDLRQYMASDNVDLDELKKRTSELQEKSWKVTQQAYQSSDQQGSGGSEEKTDDKKDDAKDAKEE